MAVFGLFGETHGILVWGTEPGNPITSSELKLERKLNRRFRWLLLLWACDELPRFQSKLVWLRDPEEQSSEAGIAFDTSSFLEPFRFNGTDAFDDQVSITVGFRARLSSTNISIVEAEIMLSGMEPGVPECCRLHTVHYHAGSSCMHRE